jgi:hypothetical protein
MEGRGRGNNEENTATPYMSMKEGLEEEQASHDGLS